MSGFTEAAIKKAFFDLLAERPYSSITVKDVAATCGVSRNTFYYHFQDIPALLESAIREICDGIIQKYPKLSSLEACLHVLAEFASSNRPAILHLYHSVDRAIYETHLWKICDYVVRTYIQTAISEPCIRKLDDETVYRYYRCICFGYVMDWLENGMSDDLDLAFKRLLDLKQAQIDGLIQNGGAI